MPKITHQQNHQLSNEEALRRIQELVGRFSSNYHFQVEWKNETYAKVSGTGVNGEGNLQPGQVTFSLDLSFLLSPFKSKIESEIAKELKQALA
jgi:putative polyhydroxyalkanoate system protein